MDNRPPPPPFQPPMFVNSTMPVQMNPNDNTFARLIDQLNFSNVTAMNLSQQMNNMRSEMQSLIQENARLNGIIRNMSGLSMVQPSCSTPRSDRYRNENEPQGAVRPGSNGQNDAWGNIGSDHVVGGNDDEGDRDDANNNRARVNNRAGGDAGNVGVWRGVNRDIRRAGDDAEQRWNITEIEAAFTEFSGTDLYSVNKWIVDFEEVADSIGLSDLRRFVLAKKKLVGLAKLSLSSMSNITTWSALKVFLRNEFEYKENSAVVHEKLRARKKLNGENVLEYFLVMREIGAKADLDIEAVVTHTINGINDNGPDKTILYGTKSIAEFREKLRLYQSLKDAKYGRDSTEPPTAGRRQNNCSPPRNSGAKDRSPNKASTSGTAKTIVCYSCGQAGHISRDCANGKQDQTMYFCSSESSLGQGTSLDIKINSLPIRAVFDSGSDVSLLNDQWVKKLRLTVNGHGKKKLVTLNGSVWTLGTVNLDVEVNDTVLRMVFDVLDAKELPHEVILGRNLLLYGDVSVTVEGAKFKVKDELFAMRIVVAKLREEPLEHEPAVLVKYAPRKTQNVKVLLKTDEMLIRPLTRRKEPLFENLREEARIETLANIGRREQKMKKDIVKHRKEAEGYNVSSSLVSRRSRFCSPWPYWSGEGCNPARFKQNFICGAHHTHYNSIVVDEFRIAPGSTKINSVKNMESGPDSLQEGRMWDKFIEQP